jgi:hypothetical protein
VTRSETDCTVTSQLYWAIAWHVLQGEIICRMQDTAVGGYPLLQNSVTIFICVSSFYSWNAGERELNSVWLSDI